jgi:hypothetical protein
VVLNGSGREVKGREKTTSDFHLKSTPLGLGASVPTVNAKVRSGSELGRVGGEVDHGALEVFGFADATHGGEVHPGVAELLYCLWSACGEEGEGGRGGKEGETNLRVAVEDNAGESGSHVTGRNAVDTDVPASVKRRSRQYG